MSVVAFRGNLERGVAINLFSGYLAHSVVHRLLRGLPERGPKPFTVWPLLIDGRPAVGLAAAAAGAEVELRAAFFDEELGRRFMEAVEGGFDLFGARVAPAELEFWRPPRPAARQTPAFRVEFLSPTRFETPPYVRRPRPVYDLTPAPRNVFKSALKTAERLGLWGPAESKRLYRWAYAAVGITDFRIRPVAVSLTGGRTARGFVGWAVYRAFETSMLGEMWRALSAAADFGLGANRPLGFGAVRITPLEGTARPSPRRGGA
ncbi:MAG: CRISPR-associated endoribonuclease Cas6 [Pyrobaculum sp.]|jgi:CRISPR-associated endoribonuclease Cas6|nr:CRISPR-associated endoribonuclease Cas6 [Pyrobaculum sp.]